MDPNPPIFLRADWRYLAMLNFSVPPAILQPLVPFGTELDFFEGETYLSIVGFLFLNTRVLRLQFPFHSNFEEVNLRFYVRRREGEHLRRAAVFIQELVPKFAIATVARYCYNENYFSTRMRHALEHTSQGVTFQLEWFLHKIAHALSIQASGDPHPLQPGSHEEFIADHYWGYSSQPNGDTIEYAVRHPSWRIWSPVTYQCNIDFESLYGKPFAQPLAKPPRSVFLAEGSSVTISRGRRLRRRAIGSLKQ